MYAVVDTTRVSEPKPHIDFHIFPHMTKRSAEAQRKRHVKILRESGASPSDCGVLVAHIARADERLLEGIGKRYSLTICYSIASSGPRFDRAWGPWFGNDGKAKNLSRAYARDVLKACGVPVDDLPDWQNLLPLRGFIGQSFDES